MYRVVLLGLLSLTIAGCSAPDEPEPQQPQAAPPELTPELAKQALLGMLQQPAEKESLNRFPKRFENLQALIDAKIEPQPEPGHYHIGRFLVDLTTMKFYANRGLTIGYFAEGTFAHDGKIWVAGVLVAGYACGIQNLIHKD